MDAGTIVAITVPPLSTLAGVGAGWLLAQRGAQKDREWRERQTIRERQERVAAAFDAELSEALQDMPVISGPARDIADRLGAVHAKVMRARMNASVLADPEIERRFRALDMGLYVQAQHADAIDKQPRTFVGGPEPQASPYPLDHAVADLRVALAKFQLREDPPPAVFPEAGEVVDLAWEGGRDRGLDEVARVVRERELARLRREEVGTDGDS